MCFPRSSTYAAIPDGEGSEETYGEDPYLNGILSCAAIKGLQGSSSRIARGHVAATLKHLVGHGEPDGGQNTAPASYAVRTLYDYLYLLSKYCISKVKPASIMPSYNEVDGLPSHANKWLLQDVHSERNGNSKGW